ncbi:hypothetical protein SAY87_026807 [Trapa incisa]|uniref:C2H2-type domain-containing protein n=1 Tax=Trapa incisa TaxID=236973 RepID=A0AAN7GYE0_9MYRT|nr:hypothetical protein SAY87_026807 [Trapa incisa]
MMKRSREVSEIFGLTDGGCSIDLARCLVMLSHGQTMTTKATQREDSYECKTCNRKFPSFQALGGHRASHKKPRIAADGQAASPEEGKNKLLSLSLGVKPKMHECSICGLEFPMGQALGGHMRRHRVETMKRFEPYALAGPPLAAIRVLKRSNSSKRIGCLDLNLTPLENDLKMLFGEKAPKVDGFL